MISSICEYLIEKEGYQVIFSHLHNVDACGHLFWYLSKDRPAIGNHGALYEEAIEWAYRCTDTIDVQGTGPTASTTLFFK